MQALRSVRLLLLLLSCLPSLASAAPPIARLTADRAPSGKAPLLVYFEAQASTDLDTTRPFHQLTYCFDAGDGNTERYTLANTSGRFAEWPKATFCGGPAFAYVYETPGTYTATVTAIDEDGNQDTARLAITVTAFDAAETVCVRDSSSPSTAGCPAGATIRTEGEPRYGDVAQAVDTAFSTPECEGGTAPCRRILFQGGGTFPMTAGVQISGDTRHVGGYGQGKFTIDMRGTSPSVLFSVINDDVRVSDFSARLTSRPSGNGALLHVTGTTAADSDYILMRNADTDGTRYITTIPGSRQGELEAFKLPNVIGFFEVDSSDCGNEGANCYFTAAQKLAIVGSRVSDSRNGEHLVRLNHAGEDADSTGGAFIYANQFELSARRKHAITARVGNIRCTVDKNWGGDFWGEQVIIANNHFESNSQATVDIGQGNGCCLARKNCTGPTDEPKHRDNIVEGNFFTVRPTPDIGTVNLISPRIIHIHKDLTVRNNTAIMQPSGLNASMIGAAVENMAVYNNAIYGGNGSNDSQNVLQNPDSPGCDVRNNVAWGPRGARIFEGTPCRFRNSNNWQKNPPTTGTQQLTSCPYANCPPATLQDFRLKASDPDGLINGGARVPVKVDIFQRLRPKDGFWDVGAFEMGASGGPPLSPAPPLLPPFLLE